MKILIFLETELGPCRLVSDCREIRAGKNPHDQTERSESSSADIASGIDDSWLCMTTRRSSVSEMQSSINWSRAICASEVEINAGLF